LCKERRREGEKERRREGEKEREGKREREREVGEARSGAISRWPFEAILVSVNRSCCSRQRQKPRGHRKR
jgi:hypothetical protein